MHGCCIFIELAYDSTHCNASSLLVHCSFDRAAGQSLQGFDSMGEHPVASEVQRDLFLEA